MVHELGEVMGMTNTQTVLYTVAVTLSTVGVMAVIAWAWPEALAQGPVPLILGVAGIAWMFLIVSVAHSRHAAREAERRRRERAVRYTAFSRRIR